MIFSDFKTSQSQPKTLKDTQRQPKPTYCFLMREEGGFAWSEAHNSNFALDKLAVTHFTRRRRAAPGRPGHPVIREAPALILRGELVKVLQVYKYLGIYVDSQLNWKTQAQKAIAKAMK